MASSDKKLKHLEMIQSVISRMASNAFLLKAWSVAIIAALFALAAKDADTHFIVVAYLPLVIFWGLDAYYLMLERRFRNHYDEVRLRPEDQIDFSMSPVHGSSLFREWFVSVLSITILLFYVPLIILTVVVGFVTN